MEAIFDRTCSLVGWLKEDKVFDTSMKFRAFIRGTGVFSTNCRHLGFFMNGVFRDRNAGAVGFLRGFSPGPTPPTPPTPTTPATPPTPPTPPAPATPPTPPTPVGSWASTLWDEFLNPI